MNKWGAGEAKSEILFRFQKYRIFSFGGRIGEILRNGMGRQKMDLGIKNTTPLVTRDSLEREGGLSARPDPT